MTPARLKLPVNGDAVVVRNGTSPRLAVTVTAPGRSLRAVPETVSVPSAKLPSAGVSSASTGGLAIGTGTTRCARLPAESIAVITSVWFPEPALRESTTKR